ncbi:hypothetical protein G6F62_006609 [Rhizopus arrhizus]|nr:hypothetical protein G6F32_011036 [Rhizopus arrhizus]KAG1333879.1 hypothetical protein G6F62_006609 [Rhizopus arrhizus]KAG1394141.1 hypothetical protein G6F60_011053 [Rhizopus arrhizus]
MLFSATQTAKATDLARVLLKKDVDVHGNRDILIADGLEQDQVKEHIDWNEDHWRNIVWSDESRFCVEGSSCEIIETGSVDQETYITILANIFHLWFTDVMMRQERDFIIQEDGASCHTGGYARWWKEAYQIRDFAY